MTAELVRIERPVYGGSGLARRANGAVTFVPFALPGELVEIAGDEDGNEAKLLKIVEESTERVQPRCPHFGRCGGCQYQDAAYSSQLAMKLAILQETMQRACVFDVPEVAAFSGEPWAYRNRIRVRVEQEGGELRVGYSVRASNQFLPVTACPIAAPLLTKAAFAWMDAARESSDARAWAEAAKEVEFFMNEDASRLSMTVFMKAKPPELKNSFASMCEALRARIPELAGASAVPFSAAGAATQSEIQTWGSAGILYRAAGEPYWISRGGFFQVNRDLVDELIRLVCDGRSGEVAWDLYAGVGLFSRVLARNFARVRAVEANPVAFSDLRVALARMGAKHSAAQATTLAFLRGAVVQRERPELVVLDPPRAGAGAEACELLLKLAPAETVYVSCNPTTLARDLAVLQTKYRITEMHLVDLFPQTFHMETVVTLKRK